MPDIHLPIGTSSVHRVMACPASYRRSKTAPRGSTSSAASEGTMLHTIMEAVYADDKDAKDLVGGTFNDKLIFTEDMRVEQIVPAITATEKLLDLIDADELVLEQFVEYAPGLVGGTLDMIAVSADEKTLLLNDYKFGFLTVSPENNKQILLATLAASVDPKTKHLFDKAEKFVGAITQPKSYDDTAPTWTFTKKELYAFEDELFIALEEAESLDPRAASGSHCKFCPAAPFCSEKKLAAQSALVMNLNDAEQLSAVLDMVDELDVFIKSAKALAHDLLEKGANIPNYKLVQKRASRVWVEPEIVETIIRNDRKMKIADAYTMKLKSPAQIEKLCKTLELPYSKFEEQQVKMSSGTTMVHESDKRPPIGKTVIPENLIALTTK